MDENLSFFDNFVYDGHAGNREGSLYDRYLWGRSVFKFLLSFGQ